MKTVRRLKCKKDMAEMLVVDGIYVEYALTPHHFYPPGRMDLIDQVGLDIREMEKRNILEEYFEELSPLAWKESREYPQVITSVKKRLNDIEPILEEKKYLESLLIQN